jgi:hypothetical protein
MANRQTARKIDPSATHESASPATIVRFPLVLSVLRTQGESRPRPSLALNVFLIVLLVLACVLWEAVSVRKEQAHDFWHSPVTSPRATTLESPTLTAEA